VKRAEVTEGLHVFWSDYQDWLPRGGSRAVVLRPAVAKQDRWSRAGYTAVEPGAPGYSKAQVEIKLLSDDGKAESFTRVVPLSQLKGTWEVIAPKVAQYRAEARADEEARNQARLAAQARANDLVDRTRELLGKDTVGAGYSTKLRADRTTNERATLTIEADLLEVLLDLAVGIHVIEIDPATGEVTRRSYDD
jgi:hypothetical protein